ncbi:MAG: DUF7059 domain-containing protein [Brooklawnia sp.]|jgi:16S rRNA G966 N2-methylase RsmD
MIDELRESLLAANYTVDAVLERLGEAAQSGLHRNSTIPARAALGDDSSPLATLIRLFPLASAVSLEQARNALPVDALRKAGLLQVEDHQVRASVDLRPYAFDTGSGQWDGWVVSDHTPGLDHDRRPIKPDYVLGVSPASTTLAQLTIPDRVGSALDLGTGCGVQSLHLSRQASRVVATDVNPRCLQLAEMTAALNQVEVDLRAGSLYEPVAGERFDLIVTNPPYVMSPPADSGRLAYREAGFTGDELVRQVVTGCIEHLNPQGTCQVLANWAITDEPVEERLAGWAAAGADLWVIERELLDPYEYIELWLTDAGLAGDPSWTDRYVEWLQYFDRLGIRGVGMGWMTVVNAGREQPDFTFEVWHHEVAQPLGPTISRRPRALDEAAVDDARLLATHFELQPDVVQETLGTPGAPDPQYLVLRQGAGLKRAMDVGTAFSGVLGACDGELPLGVIIGAVASLLDQDAETLRDELLPKVRNAIRQDYLRPVRL